jgi:hypothetical protein
VDSIWVQALLVAAAAVAGLWLTERFSPDDLLTKLVKLGIFVAVVLWVIFHLVPRIT